MDTCRDFKELLELFNKNKVEYTIVGAHALAYHGCPRYTGDLDLFVKPSKENANHIIKALEEFGFGSVDLGVEDFSAKDKVIQLGVPPIRMENGS